MIEGDRAGDGRRNLDEAVADSNPPHLALLIAGPLLFLAAIIAASVYWAIVTRGDAQAIAEQTSKSMPVMLVAV